MTKCIPNSISPSAQCAALLHPTGFAEIDGYRWRGWACPSSGAPNVPCSRSGDSWRYNDRFADIAPIPKVEFSRGSKERRGRSKRKPYANSLRLPGRYVLAIQKQATIVEGFTFFSQSAWKADSFECERLYPSTHFSGIERQIDHEDRSEVHFGISGIGI